MRATKKKSINQLEKYSAVFTQLGLVLTLFIVFIFLEHTTEKTNPIAYKDLVTDNDTYQLFDNKPVIVVKKAPQNNIVKTKTEEPKIFLENITLIENKEVEDFINTTPDEKPEVNFRDKLPDDIPEIIKDTEVSFLIIEDAPVFKGCENLSKTESKKCFIKKITQFVQRNFNVELAQDLGLRLGKHKIYSQFLIDKTGKIKEVKIRAPHKRLEKEVKKIILKIPQFIPGKQRGKPVKVRYTLPITFQVD